MALAFHGDENGTSWPSIRTLVSECNLCERAVQHHLRILAESGLVKIECGGGRHHSNSYTVMVGNPAPDAPFTEKPRMAYTVSGAGNPASHSNKPRTPCTPTVRNGQELPRGENGHRPPVVFDKELKDRIKLAEDKINRIKLQGNLTAEDHQQIKELRKKQRAWEDEVLSR